MQEALIHLKQAMDLGSEFDWAGILGLLLELLDPGSTVNAQQSII